MDSAEINQNIRIFAGEHDVPAERVVVIPKNELVAGRTYQGNCRNASEAVWDGSVFVYDRHKFGSTYKERINHFEDDDGYDVFVPMKILDKSHQNN
jgi:hypothetical protein